MDLNALASESLICAFISRDLDNLRASIAKVNRFIRLLSEVIFKCLVIIEFLEDSFKKDYTFFEKDVNVDLVYYDN